MGPVPAAVLRLSLWGSLLAGLLLALRHISIQNRKNVPFATVLGVVNGLIAMFLMLGGNKLVKKTLGKSLW